MREKEDVQWEGERDSWVRKSRGMRQKWQVVAAAAGQA